MPHSLRRWIRRFAVSVTALLSLLVAVLGLLQLPVVATWAVRRLTPLIPLNPGFRLEVGRVSGDWIHGVELAHVVLRHRGRELVRVERLLVRYDPRRLPGEPRLAEVLVDGARVHARRERETWDLAEAFHSAAGSPAGGGGGGSLAVDRIELRKVQLAAQLAPNSVVRVRNLSLQGRALALESPIRLTVGHLAGAIAPPGTDRWLSLAARGSLTGEALRVDTLRIQAAGTSVSARAVLPRDIAGSHRLPHVDLALRAAPVALADLGAFVPAVNPRGALWLETKATGAERRVRLRVSARLDRATLELDGSVPLGHGGPAGYQGTAALRRFDPSRLLRGAPTGDVSGRLDAGVLGPTPDSLRGRIRARVDGSRLGTTDLRRLDLRADLEAGRAELGVKGDIGGVAVRASGWVRPFDSLPSYRVEGSSHHLPGGRVLARALAGEGDDAVLDSGFRLAGAGLGPTTAELSGVAWLAAARPGGESVLLGETRIRLWHGRFVARPALRLGGGRMSALVLAHLGHPISYEVRQGSITQVHPGSLVGDSLVAPLSGRFTLSGRGLGPSQASATLRLDLDRPGYGRARFDSLGATVQLRGGQARAALRGAAQRGRVTVDLAVRPFESPASLTFRNGRADSLDLGALLGRPSLRTSLNARFTAFARGTPSGGRVGGLTVGLLPSRVASAELREGSLGLTVSPDTLVGTARLDGPDGEMVAELRGSTGGSSRKLEADGTVRLEHLARWSNRPDLDGRLEGRFAVRGTSDSAGVRSVGGAVTASGGVGAVRLDPIHIAFTPHVDVLQLDTLIVRSNVAALSGAGHFALRGPGDEDSLRIVGQLSDPAPLATILGLETASLDSGRLALTVTGRSRPRLDGEADLHGLLVGDRLTGRLTIRAGGLLAGPTGPDIGGVVRVENGAYGRLTVRSAQLSGRYGPRFALSGMAALDDSLRVATALTGTLGDTVRARLQRLDIGAWSLERPADLVAGPRIEVDHLALRAGGRRLSIDGVLDRHGASDLTARFDSVDLGLLRELGLPSVPGRLDGSVHLAGTPGLPAVDGDLTLTVLPKPRRELGRIHAALTWRPAGLHIDASAEPRRGGRLSVTGTLPVRIPLLGTEVSPRSSSDSVAIAMRADGFDLGFLGPLVPSDHVSSLRGRLALQGRIGGTLYAPRASGTLALSGVSLTLPGTGLSYRQGTLTGRLDGDHLAVDSFDILTGKKQGLTAQGSLLLRPLDDPSLDLSAKLHDFRIANTAQLQTAASGAVRLTGTLAAPVVTGRVQLGPTDVFTGASSGAPVVEQAKLSAEDLRLVARQFGPAAIRRAHARPALLQRVRLAVDLDMPSRVWVRRRIPPTMDIELQGKARLRQDPGGPIQLFGSVQPMLGTSTLAISGRTFRITGGTVRLDGPINAARLDVNAEYQAPAQSSAGDEAASIEAEARGTPDSLALSFTSDPSMTQEDILAYLVSGAPASGDPLAGSEVAGEAVLGEQLAVSQVSEAFSRRVAQGLGFDVFDVQPDVTYGLTLTAGRYLSSRLFAELQLPLQGPSSAPEAPVAPVGPSFELDYRLRSWISAGVRAGSVPAGVSLRGQRVY